MALPALNDEHPLLVMNDLLAPRIKSVRFTAGSRIFEQNSPGDCAYIVDSGHVEISSFVDGKKRSLSTLGAGELFGEMALLDGRPRSAAATALHDTTVIAISRQQLLEEVNGGSPIARLVLIAAIERLRSSQEGVLDTDSLGSPRPHSSADLAAHFVSARNNAAEQLRLRFQFESAISNQQFELAYQPIVSLTDGRTAGFEALLRWPLPGKKPVSPAVFIPLAESTGLIAPLGIWVLENALRSLSILHRKYESEWVFMSVNVSPRQLNSEENVERLANIIEHADIDSSLVKLEMTEQILIENPMTAATSLSRLKETGASIAIDDFGTGYSSLNYLHRYPLDTLKVDRSFVSRITDDRSRQRVVSAILGLSRELGMEVVAEGIEDKDELHWLQDHSCHFGQGFLFAKPSPFTEALGFLEKAFEW